MSLDPTYIPDQPYNSDAVNRARNLLEAIPETVGPYRILERIGTGGMGEVYRAEQRTPIRREVALKLIKLGMDTKLVIARFEAERQALALMDHPHIAKVFDANADDAGRPYFVMEYVKGKPITEYADHQRLSIPERLELFEQVCQAVQHAHHKGVIHRDLKPSNVLVCTQDGKPFSKVIDFGVAKAIVQRLTEKTFFTEDGQFVGTPHYMSPEQAEGSIDIDTRTDVYSLGVLLYELLTGSTPFAGDELRKAAFDQLKRMVIEVDPPKPSTRLLASSASGRASALRVNAPVPAIIPSPPKSGEKVPEGRMRGTSSASPIEPTPLETLARHRSTEPKRLSILVRGELDWIVMKALEKDRKRRYETPSSLATDIRSHLSGGTVLAAPPSLWYRTQKFARKYRYALIGTGTAFALLLLAFLGTTYGLRRARIAEEIARTSATQAVAARDEAMQERDAKEAQRKLAEAAMLAEAQQRELAERKLIEGILRPIGFGTEPNTAELRAFIDWSAIHDTELRHRVLETAFKDPSTALRLARRTERTIQAAVAMSPLRRKRALEFVSAKQLDLLADPKVRVAACWLAMELGSSDLPALDEAVQYLTTLDPMSDFDFRDEFVKYTLARKDPLQQLAINERLVTEFEAILCREGTPYGLDVKIATDGLEVLLPRLEPVDVKKHFLDFVEKHNELERKIGKEDRPEMLMLRGSGLEVFAAHLGSADALEMWRLALKNDGYISNSKDDPFFFMFHSSVLSRLAPRLPFENAREAWDTLFNRFAISHQLDEEAKLALIALMPRLPVGSEIDNDLDVILAQMEETKDLEVLLHCSDVLSSPSVQLDEEKLLRAANALLAGLGLKYASVALQAVDSFAIERSADRLSKFAPHLTSEAALKQWRLILLLLNTSDLDRDLEPLDSIFIALSKQLNTADALNAWQETTSAIADGRCYTGLRAVSAGLKALALQLSGDVIKPTWSKLVQLGRPLEDSFANDSVLQGLISLAPHLLTDDVDDAWSDCLLRIQLPLDERKEDLAVMSLLAPRISEQTLLEAEHELSALALSLKDTFEDRHSLRIAEQLLASLGPRLNSRVTKQWWKICVDLLGNDQALDDGYSETRKDVASQILVYLAPIIEETDVLTSLPVFLKPLRAAKHPYEIRPITSLLPQLLCRLNPSDSNRISEDLLAAFQRFDTFRQLEFSECLVSATGSLQRKPDRDQMAVNSFTLVLDLVSSNSFDQATPEECFSLDEIIAHLSDPPQTARLLNHPGCVNVAIDFAVRDSLLQRFEELVFHDGNRVFLKLPEEDGERQGNYENPPSANPVAGANEHGGLTPNRSPSEPPPRRFHTVHDAAAWIQQNWPDFDLEATHPVVWGGEM